MSRRRLARPTFFYVQELRAVLERNERGHYRLRLGIAGVEPSPAIVALDQHGRTIGVLLHDVQASGRVMISRLTYVAAAWRGRGLATELWDCALSRRRIRHVRVTVISDGGLTLIRALERRHAHVRFEVVENARRKLRDRAA